MAAGNKPSTIAPAEVATAGTRVQLSTDHIPTQSMVVQADPDNNGNVYLGDATVDSSNGIALVPGEKLGIDGLRREPGNDDSFLDDWYLDSDSDGNKLRILSLVRR